MTLLVYALVTIFLVNFPSCLSIRSQDEQKFYDTVHNPKVYRALKTLEVVNVLSKLAEDYKDVPPIGNKTCIGHLLLYHEGMQTGKRWARKMIDSSSVYPPPGFLDGNIMDLGLYDECLSVKVGKNTMDFQGRYCSVIYSFTNFVLPFYPYLSICVPNICDSEDIDEIYTNYIANNPNFKELGITYKRSICSVEDSNQISTGTTLTLVLFGAMAVILTLITIADIYDRRQKDKSLVKAYRPFFKISIYTSWLKLISFKNAPGTLPYIHGMRVISMLWIMAIHEFFMSFFFPANNNFQILDHVSKWYFALGVMGVYAVDTFFTISGFLVSYTFFQDLQKGRRRGIFSSYVRRYIRLTPQILVLLLISSYLAEFTISGPFSSFMLDNFASSCKERTWSVLLYIQNFVHPENVCMGHTWYLAVDMQLFWISPIFLYALMKSPKLGYAMMILLYSVGAFMSGWIIFKNNYRTAAYEPGSSLEELAATLFHHYMTPYLRIGPYLFGIITGYVISNKKINPIQKIHAVTGWLVMVTCFLFIFVTYLIFINKSYEYNVFMEVCHTFLTHSAWGIAISWLIYACAHDQAGIIGKVLSARLFIPLSRVSYCFYLVHLLIQVLIYSITRRTVIYYTITGTMYSAIGTAAIALIAATILMTTVEAPFSVLESMIKPKSPPRETTVEENAAETSIGTLISIADNPYTVLGVALTLKEKITLFPAIGSDLLEKTCIITLFFYHGILKHMNRLLKKLVHQLIVAAGKMTGTIIATVFAVLLSQFSLQRLHRIPKYEEWYSESTFHQVSKVLAPKNLLESHARNSHGEKAKYDTCAGQLLLYAEGIARREMWALKMLDSSSKIPSGILQGNIQELGMFDECMGVQTTIRDVELRGRHCMYSFVAGNLSFYYPTLSICIPAACDNNSLAYILNNSLINDPAIGKTGLQLSSVTCTRVEPEKWEPAAILTLCAFSILLLFLLCSTIIDIVNRVSGLYVHNSYMQKLVKFSFYTNTLRIMSTERNNETITILAGIRFLSMCWVLLGHEYLNGVLGSYINMADVSDWLDSVRSLPIILAFYAVDTFFAISGFLIGYTVIKELASGRRFNIAKMYLHRYIRLTPALLALLLFVTYILPRMGSGAHWDTIMEPMSRNCEHKWWAILLYVQNYIKRDEYCVPHCWYLAVDMQLFWFSPVILYPLARKSKWGIIILITCLLISLVTPAVLIYVNNYPISMEININPEKIFDSFRDIYTVAYCRAAPYILGILFAYLSINKKLELKRKSYIIAGWLMTISSFAFVIFMSQYFKSKDYKYNAPLEAFYASVSRPIWAFAVLWIIVSSIHGYGGPITAFLSHPLYFPLGRISYCFYLLHFNLQIAWNSSSRIPRYFSNTTLMPAAIHEIFIVSVLAFIASLLFESPFIIMEKMLKEYRSMKKCESREQIINDPDSGSEEHENS
ncbi:uncharacterized protein [Prorops nasuta]|uniref:uncharacterized protein n=1 Tax=Prorops nasuta TaxID=863751 RepID=UPI0034CE49D4